MFSADVGECVEGRPIDGFDLERLSYGLPSTIVLNSWTSFFLLYSSAIRGW